MVKHSDENPSFIKREKWNGFKKQPQFEPDRTSQQPVRGLQRGAHKKDKNCINCGIQFQLGKEKKFNCKSCKRGVCKRCSKHRLEKQEGNGINKSLRTCMGCWNRIKLQELTIECEGKVEDKFQMVNKLKKEHQEVQEKIKEEKKNQELIQQHTDNLDNTVVLGRLQDELDVATEMFDKGKWDLQEFQEHCQTLLERRQSEDKTRSEIKRDKSMLRQENEGFDSQLVIYKTELTKAQLEGNSLRTKIEKIKHSATFITIEGDEAPLKPPRMNEGENSCKCSLF